MLGGVWRYSNSGGGNNGQHLRPPKLLTNIRGRNTWRDQGCKHTGIRCRVLVHYRIAVTFFLISCGMLVGLALFGWACIKLGMILAFAEMNRLAGSARGGPGGQSKTGHGRAGQIRKRKQNGDT
jgi:hypothetical protein